MSFPVVAALPLAAGKPSPEDVNPLWYWFAIFVFLVVAVVFLYLSLRKQLKKVDFPVEGETGDSGDAHDAPVEDEHRSQP